jgi:hypothetical protein
MKKESIERPMGFLIYLSTIVTFRPRRSIPTTDLLDKVIAGAFSEFIKDVGG